MPPERSAVRLDLLVSTARKQKIKAGGDPLQVICKNIDLDYRVIDQLLPTSDATWGGRRRTPSQSCAS